MNKAILFLLISAVFAQESNGQEVVTRAEKVSLDSPEGWAMAHTLSAALNLGAPPATDPQAWVMRFSAELGSIPHLSRAEQQVGFGGFKSEDLNKSPVFGRGRFHLGLPGEYELELSWTPPLEINGSKPDEVFGLALQKSLYRTSTLNLSVRLFALRGEAQGDITCSRDVASAPPGSAGNPFGCREPSNDSMELDHEGLEFIGSRLSHDGRWQPYFGLAYTRIHPFVNVEARVFEVLDRAELYLDDAIQSATVGTLYHWADNWTLQAAFSYTPLDIRRPPELSRRNQDFWSVRLGLHWRPGWTAFQ
ncbi:MAG: hypothetical protein R3F50_05310 [Gammaproteobacteria bacterium]